MNSAKPELTAIHKLSEQYIIELIKIENHFKSTIISFLTSTNKKYLILETRDSTVGAVRIRQLLQVLKKDVEYQRMLGNYLTPYSQIFLRWDKLTRIIKLLEFIPDFKNLLVCEFCELVKLKTDDAVTLNKIIDNCKTSISKKVIFIGSQEGFMNDYLKDTEITETVKINEINTKIGGSVVDADKIKVFFDNVSQGHVRNVETLLHNGVDVNSIRIDDNQGLTALHIAVQNNNEAMVWTLCKNGAKILPSVDEQTPLHLAAKKGFKDIVLILLKNADDDIIIYPGPGERTALHEATIENHHEIVKILLMFGADVHATTAEGCTSLHHAACGNNTSTSETLLSYGADPNIQDNAGMTALHLATYIGCSDVIDFLLKKGASTDIRNNDNRTPLDIAVNRSNNELVKLFRTHKRHN